MDYFKLPGGYDCFEVNGSNIRAYSNSYRDRATYSLINFKWELVAVETRQTAYVPTACLTTTDYLIPEDMAGSCIVAAVIAASVLVIGLFKVFSR